MPDLGVGAGTWLLLLVATCLVCLLAAVSAGRLPVRHESLEAVAVGIVLALLVEVVPRLTANTTVGLALAMRALAAPDLRGPLTTDGPVVIQNGMTALLFGTFLVSLRFPSGRVSGRVASLWVAAFALAALADGLANANARGPWSASMLVSFVFVEATRAAEVIGLAGMHVRTSGVLRVYRHAANRVSLALGGGVRWMVVLVHGDMKPPAQKIVHAG